LSVKAGATSLSMGQGPPPASTLPLPLAKVNCAEINKKQWGIGAEDPTWFGKPAPQTVFAAESGQTFLGMGGPRAAGHREKFGGKHAATMLAIACFLWQPISQAGMYSVQGGQLSKQSFSELKVPGWGNLKSVPTIESLFPFDKTGFAAGPALFSSKSMVVFDNPLGKCGAYNNKESSCHSFFDEIGDAMSKSPETPSRSTGKASFSFPWAFDKATWNK
ncbi:hypothetical protein T484DRAFT_1963033, partial [Baffinella frigidus]